ncbi:MAG: hypothetical protein V1875_01640 [Candidatus Altiarchaeota archaeon]
MKLGAILLLLATMSCVAEATVIGVSPGTLSFKNSTRGGEYVGYLTISTSDKQIHCTATPTGETAKWISFDQNPFDVTSENQYRLPVRLIVPEMVPNGRYEGSIELSSTPPKDAVGGTGMTVGAAIYIKTVVDVSGVEGANFRVMKVTASNVKEGEPLKAEIMTKNNAPNAVKPGITLTIMSPDKKNTYKTATYDDETVDSLTKKTITKTVPTKGLAPGIYILDFSITVMGTESWKSQEVFYIVSSDQKTDDLVLDGRLESAILSSENLTLGEKLTITGTFSNTGEAPLDVKLKANVIQDKRTIQVAESNNTLVNATKNTELTITYEPPQAGDYSLQIWAEYSGKKTSIRTSTIRVWTVSKPLLGLDQNFYLIIGPAILLAIMWLIFYYREYYQRRE